MCPAEWDATIGVDANQFAVSRHLLRCCMSPRFPPKRMTAFPWLEVAKSETLGQTLGPASLFFGCWNRCQVRGSAAWLQKQRAAETATAVRDRDLHALNERQ